MCVSLGFLRFLLISRCFPSYTPAFTLMHYLEPVSAFSDESPRSNNSSDKDNIKNLMYSAFSP